MSASLRVRNDLDWSPPEHPRDRRGRFTESGTIELTDAERTRVSEVINDFSPREFAAADELDDYMSAQSGGYGSPEWEAMQEYCADDRVTAAKVNQALRSNKPSTDYDDTIEHLREAMRPMPDDLVLNRTVSEKAFGRALDDLPGMKVRDSAFSSTSLGVSYEGDDLVQVKIAAPKGTPAIFTGDSSPTPEDREVLLADGQEFAVTSVTKGEDDRYQMSLVALPADDVSRETEPEPAGDDGRNPTTPEEFSDDWRANVTPTPEELEVLGDYTGGGYQSMNEALRYGDDPYDVTDKIDTLHGLINRYQMPAATTAYRSLTSGVADPESDTQLLYQDDMTGELIEAPGFSSASLGEIDSTFAYRKVVMEITVPKGLNALIVDGTDEGVKDENELILPHNTRFQVDSDETLEGGKRWLKVTALPPVTP